MAYDRAPAARHTRSNPTRYSGLHRQAAGLCASILLLAGCSTISRPADRPLGELHNQGVKYVLEHLDRNPPRAELSNRIIVLTQDYCERMLHVPRGRCTVFLPERWENANGLIQRMNASEPFKESLQTLVRTVDAAETLPELDRGLAALESRAGSRLNRIETAHLSDAISIARSSATLWAPIDQGGLNGRGISFPVTPPAEFRFPWKPLLKADLLGCLSVVLTGGCLGGAVVGTCIAAVEILLSEAALLPGDRRRSADRPQPAAIENAEALGGTSRQPPTGPAAAQEATRFRQGN